VVFVFQKKKKKKEHKFISYFQVIVHEATGISKIRVFGVDIGQLNSNQVMNLQRDEAKGSAKQQLPVIFSESETFAGADLTISFVTGSLFRRREVTTSTMASWSFGNLNNSCRVEQPLCLARQRYAFTPFPCVSVISSTNKYASTFLTCVL